MIDTAPFGRTDHHSSRVIFGAAALWGMRPERAARVLEQLIATGVNHIDVAAGYGDAELRVGEWMPEHRGRFFLATKAYQRDRDGVRASLERSLERLRVSQIDLFQFHNLVDADGWQTVFGAGGGLEAALAARDEGLIRFIGVTGHGTYAPSMHLRSLERHDFDSVLLPYNFTMMQSAQYAADFEALASACAERRVALQTIKSAALRRYREEPARRFSWYEPLADREALTRSVRWVLARSGTFLNTTSDARLLPTILEAAATPDPAPDETELAADVARLGMEPLFVRGVSDDV